MVPIGEDELIAIVRNYAVETHGADWASKEIDAAADFETLGLDSVDAVLLTNILEDEFDVTLDPAFLLRHRSVREVISEMLRQI